MNFIFLISIVKQFRKHVQLTRYGQSVVRTAAKHVALIQLYANQLVNLQDAHVLKAIDGTKQENVSLNVNVKKQL